MKYLWWSGLLAIVTVRPGLFVVIQGWVAEEALDKGTRIAVSCKARINAVQAALLCLADS